MSRFRKTSEGQPGNTEKHRGLLAALKRAHGKAMERFIQLPYDKHMDPRGNLSEYFTDYEMKTLVVLQRSNRPMTCWDVAEAANIKPESAHRALLRLKTGDLVEHAERRETTGGRYAQQYRLTSGGAMILEKLESSDGFQSIKRDLA